MPNTWAVELVGSSLKSCVNQNLLLKTGKYQLDFMWAANSNLNLEKSQFVIKLAGQTLQKFSPKDYSVRNETVSFTLYNPTT
jgi:hypothetical protein